MKNSLHRPMEEVLANTRAEFQKLFLQVKQEIENGTVGPMPVVMTEEQRKKKEDAERAAQLGKLNIT